LLLLDVAHNHYVQININMPSRINYGYHIRVYKLRHTKALRKQTMDEPDRATSLWLPECICRHSEFLVGIRTYIEEKDMIPRSSPAGRECKLIKHH